MRLLIDQSMHQIDAWVHVRVVTIFYVDQSPHMTHSKTINPQGGVTVHQIWSDYLSM